MARKARRRLADDEVADGETIHVGLELMDSWQRDVAAWARTYRDHQPGFRTVASREVQTARDANRASRDAWLNRATQAWRPTAPAPPVADAREARRLWIDRATNAWRTPTPVRDNAAFLQPQTPTRRALWGAMQQTGAKVDVPSSLPDPAAVQARRDAQFAQRCQDLENAWRSPAAAANSVERQRRAVTNEDHRQ
jgi:hypothetical protein